jgi:hypothetical protein
MRKTSIFAFVSLTLLAPLASAVEVKHLRVTHGPMGATRAENKFLPGDYLFMSFDLEGLTFDPKTGKATYETVLELYDFTGDKPVKDKEPRKPIFTDKKANTVSPMLGGTRIPGDLHVIMGTQQKPGKYVVRLIVTDTLSTANTRFTYFDHPFELLPNDSFGIVGLTAPAVGFPGQNYVASFALVNMKLDAKYNPNVDVVMRVLDAGGLQEMSLPIRTFLPKDLPSELQGKLNKENFVPMQFPIYLNRAGRYTVEIEAIDRAANRQAKIRYTLNVIDIDAVIGR